MTTIPRRQGRWPDDFVKESPKTLPKTLPKMSPKTLPNPFLCQKYYYIYLHFIGSPKIWAPPLQVSHKYMFYVLLMYIYLFFMIIWVEFYFLQFLVKSTKCSASFTFNGKPTTPILKLAAEQFLGVSHVAKKLGADFTNNYKHLYTTTIIPYKCVAVLFNLSHFILHVQFHWILQIIHFLHKLFVPSNKSLWRSPPIQIWFMKTLFQTLPFLFQSISPYFKDSMMTHKIAPCILVNHVI
jgi:hypothetical protein